MATPNPHPNISFEAGWQEISEKAINKLISMLEEGVNIKTKAFPHGEYIHIYTTAYNMCTQNGPYVSSRALLLLKAHTSAANATRSQPRSSSTRPMERR